MKGYSNDGRRMKIIVHQTIFGNIRYEVWGFGENLFGWSGWARVGKFKTFSSAIEFAKFNYGFKEAEEQDTKKRYDN